LHEKDTAETLIFNDVIKMGRHVIVTANGRIFSFSAMIMVGNGNGTGGIGYGKAKNVAAAVVNANRDAAKNVFSIYRYDDRTIPNPISAKYLATTVKMWPRRAGFGLRGHVNLKRFANMFGIKDMTIKVFGNRNPVTMYRAFLKGLRFQIEAPEETARKLGKKLFDVNRYFYPPLPDVPIQREHIPVPYLYDDEAHVKKDSKPKRKMRQPG